MYNLWNRTYVQLFSNRDVFDTKTFLASKEWASVLFPDTIFRHDGKLVHQELSLTKLLDKHYDGKANNLLKELLEAGDEKVSVVVDYADYYTLLAYFLKELQFTYKFSDEDLHMIAYSYLYNNFYYSNDQNFVDGFVSQSFVGQVAKIFKEYEPTGILANLDPVKLPTEIGYFLVKRELIPESALADNFTTVAKLVVNRLWQVHYNDFSEWLILDTPHFLNMLKSDATPEVVTSEFSFPEMLNFMTVDPHLHAMFFSSVSHAVGSTDWSEDPNYMVSASRVISAWQKLADYLVQRGIDKDWAELRHSQYAEIILRYEYVNNTCNAVKYILKLDGAPETLDKPIIDMLGYDILSECMNFKYNKTLLLLTLRGMSSTFEGFIKAAFAEE